MNHESFAVVITISCLTRRYATIAARAAAATAVATVAADAALVVGEEGVDGHEGAQTLDELVGLRVLDGIDDDHVAQLQ